MESYKQERYQHYKSRNQLSKEVGKDNTTTTNAGSIYQQVAVMRTNKLSPVSHETASGTSV